MTAIPQTRTSDTSRARTVAPRMADGWSSKVEELYRDAKIGEIYEGTNEIQRWIIARQVFGRDATG